MVTATMVPTIATIGAINDARGIVVGSLPVTCVGPKTLTSVAADQIPTVAPNTIIHNGRRTRSPRNRAMAANEANDAPNPHSHVPKAATGIRCCSLPWIISGENTLMSTTAIQIEVTVASVQAVHELATGCHRVGVSLGQTREITTVVGQNAVATAAGTVVAVELVPSDPPACPEAVDAIAEADWVVLGPGSWFSSVIPHLLVPELRCALVETSARRMVTLNLSAEGGETEGFTPEMHLEVLGAYAPDMRLDAVIADRGSVPDEVMLRRVASDFGAEVTVTDVAIGDGTPRHDPERLAHAYADTFGRGRIPPWR